MVLILAGVTISSMKTRSKQQTERKPDNITVINKSK